MATPEKITAAAKAIADALSEIPDLRVYPYPVMFSKMTEGDGCLTLAGATPSLAFNRTSPQTVEWDLQVLLRSAASSDGSRVEREIAGFLAEDTDNSLFGKIRPIKKQANRHGSPQLESLEVSIFERGDSMMMLLVGKETANL